MRAYRCHEQEAVQKILAYLSTGQTDSETSDTSDSKNAADLEAQRL